MTLIIGIKCKDGIVMGAGGAATLGVMCQRTILQPMKKLSTIDNKIIFGSSGYVGLSQRFKGEIENLWQERKLSDKKPYEAMVKIKEVIWQHAQMELNTANIARQTLGNSTISSAICLTMIALPISRSPCLFQFDQQCSPEEATNDLPFISIGSGQPVADPFLAFLRRVFWKDQAPSIADGIFATLWTLRHTIEINPGGVAEPVQIVVLENKNGDFQTRELLNTELEEHYEAIAAAENSLLNFRDQNFPHPFQLWQLPGEQE